MNLNQDIAAIVTGGASGLGEATARALAAKGVRVAILDRDTARGIHLTGKRAGRVAQNAEASALVLTHIPVWTDCSIVRGEAAGEYRGPIELAKPGATWTV